MPFTKANAAKYGRQGGRRCLKRHGTAHMKAIGKKGFASTMAAHSAGDRAGYVAWLRQRGRFLLVEAAADILLDAGVRCVELDGDLPF